VTTTTRHDLAPIVSIEETISLIARRSSLPRVHEQLNSRAGVSLGWYAYIALYWIEASGPLRLTELARHFGVVPSTVCRHVQHLESAGLVAKTKDPVDGRAIRLVPTEKGKAVLADLRSSREASIAESLSSWSQADLEKLSSMLLRLRHDLGESSGEFLDDI
jgi:DNA-binding MarR family transcriptional regulator